MTPRHGQKKGIDLGDFSERSIPESKLGPGITKKTLEGGMNHEFFSIFSRCEFFRFCF